jgi:hypothetical protein
MTTRIISQRSSKRKTANRYEARNHLTNLLFEGQIKKACDEALSLWQSGTITADDYRFIQTRADPLSSVIRSDFAVMSRQRLVE